ncbi:carbamoyltransferase N-terminal domain-containing protein [Micromonospora sp. NPDC007271]|uniref:carbamoyltransferase N-terminal domain-containing protein n=1 Tax=Micromonospora sp. NPDC007271 TaxID=3154587 RepID=UPI0033FA3300
MIICGLKLTHDGALALVDGDRLVTSLEMEKLDNNRRHESLDRLDGVLRLLDLAGCRPADVDVFVVDGWHASTPDGLAELSVHGPDGPLTLAAAPYHERSATHDAAQPYELSGLALAGQRHSYHSYHHATDHLFSAYCTSPFARTGEPAVVLVWDGGMLPLLYEVHPDPVRVVNHGPLLPIYGNAFAEFAGQFDAFREEFRAEQRRYGRTRPSAVAGKAMAYAGLATEERDLNPLFDKLLDEFDAMGIDSGALLARRLLDERARLVPGLSDADLIAGFQNYLGQALVDAFRAVLPQLSQPAAGNLCLVGGCALNIKWNSRLRGSGLFRDVWVPPFPNDSGSAIGAAMTHRARTTTDPYVRWSVYAGAEPGPARPPAGWRAVSCPPAELARLLAEVGAPVVVVDGRAEVGPRALGHRSILAPAVRPEMKDRLNELKGREAYRPVAPICLEDRAPTVFAPGSPDPYMLFEHRMRPGWAERVPAIVHLDGTARLQTVSADADPVLAEVLAAYERHTGVPVLCNTSANLRGSGFFPDVASAAEWGGTRYVWSAGELYAAPGAVVPAELPGG